MATLKKIETAVDAAVASSSNTKKKDSTSEVPMYDLEEAIRFVTKIHEEGLETAAMPEVAKGCGYKHPSSTPFYRRMLASRLFGLISKSGAELTVRAQDYLKPDFEGANSKALVDAVFAIPGYSDLVQKLQGKKLNSSLVSNGFSKTFGLTNACSQVCAKAFESSLKFADLLASDGTVSGATVSPLREKTKGDIAHAGGESEEEEEIPSFESKTHILPLDKDGKRFLKVMAPLDINAKEIKRVKKWLEVTLLIEWDENEEEAAT